MAEDKIQGGIDWFIQRLGKITSSEIYVLTKSHKEAMTDEELTELKSVNPKSRVTTKEVPFSDATFTYLNRKVMENFLPIHSKSQESRNAVEEYIELHTISSRACDFGTLWEDEARKRYAESMGYEVFEVGFIPYDKYPQLAGGSPDGMIKKPEDVVGEGVVITVPGEFFYDDSADTFYYIDNNSLNGTFVNGVRLQPYNQYRSIPTSV